MVIIIMTAVESGDTDENLLKRIEQNFLPQMLNAFTKEFLIVIADYVQAISDYGIKTSCSLQRGSVELCVQESVRACIEEKKLIVIRVASAKEDIRQTEVARKFLKKAIKENKYLCRINGPLVEVLVNSPIDKDEDCISMSIENKEIALEKIQERLGNPKIADLKELQFSDVIGIPMIMLIIEQGRMGDTFPSNTVCFDLRARFLRPVKDFTSIIQDIGRAFGYGERPDLIISQAADRFLRKIWKEDGISYASLKTEHELKSALLGKNMKRNIKQKNEQVQTTSEEDEDEEMNAMLELFRELYREDEKKPNFLYGLKAFEHRLILKAEPQCGKTGCKKMA